MKPAAADLTQQGHTELQKNKSSLSERGMDI